MEEVRPVLRRCHILFALGVLALPLGASSLPSPPREDPDQALERLLDSREGEPSGPDGMAGPVHMEESFDRLKEQILGLIPGDALESVARTFVDRRLELQVSPERAVFVVRLPID